MELHPESYTTDMSAFFALHLGPIKDILREETKQTTAINTKADIATRATGVIHRFSARLDQEYGPAQESETTVIHYLTIDQILKQSSRFRLKESDIFQIYSTTRDCWYDFPLPHLDSVLHKGGFPRVVLKILAGAKNNSIEAELPPNDFDVIGSGDTKIILIEAIRLGVDSQGVEIVDSVDDLSRHIQNRDVTLNSCFIGKNYIAFTPQAFESAQTGVVSTISRWRGIYGRDTFNYEKMEIKKARAMMRLTKAVVEEKAESFIFEPISQQQDFGIYWLVLARKFSTKENFPILMERLYYINQQLGQVLPNERDIFDVIKRVISENPAFDFNAGALDEIGSALWYTRKLVRQTDKIFRDTYHIRSNFDLVRHPQDHVPYRVSLDGFRYSGMTPSEFRNRWKKLITNSPSLLPPHP